MEGVTAVLHEAVDHTLRGCSRLGGNWDVIVNIIRIFSGD